MADTASKFKQNSVTLEFVSKAKELIDSGKCAQKDLIEKLEWNKSSMSSVMNGYRNIPIEKWDTFKEVYKDANSVTDNQEDIKAATTDEMSALFIELMKKLESIEASLQNTALISKDNNSLIRSTLLQLARQEAKGHEEIDANKIFEGSLNAAKEILKQTYDNGSNIYAPLKS